MKAQVKLGRIAGISTGLNYSWFIIALLIALSLVQHFHTVAPRWSRTTVWITAAVTALLFFVTSSFMNSHTLSWPKGEGCG